MFDGDSVVAGLVGEGNERDEAVGFVLESAELAEVIDAVFKRFNMAVKHGAGAALAHFVPGAVNIKILGGGFFSFGDGGADFGAENFSAATCKGVQSSVAEFFESLADGFFGEPGEVKNFDGGETFEAKIGIESAESAKHFGVVGKGEIGMKPADDVEFGNADGEGFAGFLDDFFDRELEAVGIALFPGEGAELAAQDAVVGVIDIAVEDVAGAVAAFAFANEIGNGADGVDVFALEEAESVGFVDALVGGDFFVDVAEIAMLDGEVHGVRRKPG